MYVKCSQARLKFELVSPRTFPSIMTVTPRVPPDCADVAENIIIKGMLIDKRYIDIRKLTRRIKIFVNSMTLKNCKLPKYCGSRRCIYSD